MTTPDDQDAAVRRLLRSVAAGDAPPVPPSVAARLDAVLADLVAERDAAGARDDADAGDAENVTAPVADLAAHRRRRLRLGLLVAAAAAVVAVAAGVPLLRGQTTNPGVDASSSSAADRGSQAAVGAQPHAPAPVAGRRPGAQAHTQDKSVRASSGSAKLLSMHRVATIRSDSLRSDLLRLRRALPAHPSYAARRPALPPGLVCRRGRFGHGLLLGVRYDGAPAVVAFRPPNGTTQVTDVLQCGTGRILDSMTLPSR